LVRQGLATTVRSFHFPSFLQYKFGLIGRLREGFSVLDSFEKLNLQRFWANCKQSNLNQHVNKRLNSFLADLKKGLIKKIWKEFTGREFIREREVTLKERISNMLENAK